MTRRLFYLLSMVVLMITIINQSCTYLVLEEPTLPGLCDTVTVTYDTHIQSIVNASCAFAGCHDVNGSAPGNFTNFAGLMTRKDLLEGRVITQQNMPPAGSTQLTADELEIFQCWINQGFLEK